MSRSMFEDLHLSPVDDGPPGPHRTVDRLPSRRHTVADGELSDDESELVLSVGITAGHPDFFRVCRSHDGYCPAGS